MIKYLVEVIVVFPVSKQMKMVRRQIVSDIPGNSSTHERRQDNPQLWRKVR